MNMGLKIAGGFLAATALVCFGYSAGKHETLAHINHHHHDGVSKHGEGHGDTHKKFQAACVDHKAACDEVLAAIGHDQLKADHDAMAKTHGQNHHAPAHP